MMAGFFNFDVTRFESRRRLSRCKSSLAARAGAFGALAGDGSAAHHGRRGDAQLWPGPRPVRRGHARPAADRRLAFVRVVSRPLILSLRNTFRRKGRLVLTLITLTLGGAIFVGIFSVRSSLQQTMNDLMGIYHFDLWVNLTHPQRIERIEQQAMDAPGVVKAAGWANLSVRRVRAMAARARTIISLRRRSKRI